MFLFQTTRVLRYCHMPTDSHGRKVEWCYGVIVCLGSGIWRFAWPSIKSDSHIIRIRKWKSGRCGGLTDIGKTAEPFDEAIDELPLLICCFVISRR